MTDFELRYTGDYLGPDGNLAIPDIALDLYAPHPAIRVDFLRSQAPQPGDTTYQARLYSLELTADDIAVADGVVIFRPWVKASTFARGAERLTVIGRAGAGYDKLDLAACTENDVAVFNAPDTLTHATASSAFILMLALAKRLPEQQAMVRDGRWDLQPATMGLDLPGKTLGIVGLGASGRELARLAAPWGMRILAFSPRASAEDAARLGVTLVPSLDDIFAQSDFVSLHNRLDASTRGMIGAHHLRLMKPTAYFINVARGEIVDQAALVEALRERWFAGAGLDVYEHEPLPKDDPLNALDNVILTPHWLPSTRDAARLTMSEMAEGMIRASRGLVPANIVNPAVLERPGFQAKLARFAHPS
jgi:phosphoglycerate dehydrogenase-like enzyme